MQNDKFLFIDPINGYFDQCQKPRLARAKQKKRSIFNETITSNYYKKIPRLSIKIVHFMFINPLYANSNHCEKPRLAWAKRRRRSVSDENDRIIGFGSSESRVASSNNNKQKIRTWQDEKETVEKYIRLTSSYCQMGLLHY